jgi:hypothetical protein
MKIHACLLLSVFLIFSCFDSSDDTRKGPVIARVGSRILYEDDLMENTSSSATAEQKLQYVQEWVNMELLSQKAKSEDYDDRPGFQERKRIVNRNLLANMYLNDALGKQQQELEERHIQSYYDNFRSEFLRKEPYVKYEMIAYNNARRAWQVRRELSSDNFNRYIQNGYGDSSYAASQPIPLHELQQRGCAFLTDIREGGISNPKNIDGRIHMYHVKTKYDIGDPYDLEEVREEVESRALYRLHKARVDSFMQTLRKSLDYQFNRDYFSTSDESDETQTTD